MGALKTLACILVFLAFSNAWLVGEALALSKEVQTDLTIFGPHLVQAPQSVNIRVALLPPPPQPTDRFHGLRLNITSPNGNVETYEPTYSTDGSYRFTYNFNELGSFKLQATYAGESFGDSFYKPSQSAVFELTSTGERAPPVEPQGGSWQTMAPMSIARGKLGVASLNGKLYAIGGSTFEGVYTPSPTSGLVGVNEEYNPSLDTWTNKTSMPTPRCSFATAVVEGKIYCIGGIIGTTLDEWYHMFQVARASGVNEAYDPATDTWTRRAPLPANISGLEANFVGGKIYIFQNNIIWIYDPNADVWAKKAAPLWVDGYVPAVVDNKVYFFGNHVPVQIYDATADAWSQGGFSPRMDSNGATAVTSGKLAPTSIYFFTVAEFGWVPYGKTDTSGSSRRTTFAYNPENDSWSAGAVMGDFRVDFKTATSDDKVYVVGGYNWLSTVSGTGNVSRANEQYTPIGYGTQPPPIAEPASLNPTASPMGQIDVDVHSEPFPFWPIAVLAISVAVLAVLAVYMSKRKNKTENLA